MNEAPLDTPVWVDYNPMSLGVEAEAESYPSSDEATGTELPRVYSC